MASAQVDQISQCEQHDLHRNSMDSEAHNDEAHNEVSVSLESRIALSSSRVAIEQAISGHWNNLQESPPSSEPAAEHQISPLTKSKTESTLKSEAELQPHLKSLSIAKSSKPVLDLTDVPLLDISPEPSPNSLSTIPRPMPGNIPMSTTQQVSSTSALEDGMASTVTELSFSQASYPSNLMHTSGCSSSDLDEGDVSRFPVVKIPFQHNTVSEDLRSHLSSPSASPQSPRAGNFLPSDIKEIIIPATRSPKLTMDLNIWVCQIKNLLDPYRADSDCWLHPNPPPCRLNLFAKSGIKRYDSISKLFKIADPNNPQDNYLIQIPFSIAHHITNNSLTPEQREGYSKHNWDASNICGNWTCLNPAHITVESATAKEGRAACFEFLLVCRHLPACLKANKPGF
ncbi:hypothetical protein BJ875DRAFT_267811 [Amylocarpus encephaloides]|uniref:Zinc-binding loop region of homing endonuclease domain-containing protein n=1 Tax=Amylocarpus encephaloides TaxID=45428 RepID=A0A9P7YL88_9HELO|nr:hypothetical protein BJ875DRAFT_267811 [Amylocarpus encephaloides]